jgi:drug/metabolite transporter (DMT)-like permease
MGYALWYYILPQLRTTTAALTQVTVPIIAALGGILLLGEEITLAFIASAVLVLAGVVVSLRR